MTKRPMERARVESAKANRRMSIKSIMRSRSLSAIDYRNWRTSWGSSSRILGFQSGRLSLIWTTIRMARFHRRISCGILETKAINCSTILTLWRFWKTLTQRTKEPSTMLTFVGGWEELSTRVKDSSSDMTPLRIHRMKRMSRRRHDLREVRRICTRWMCKRFKRH